MCVSECVCVCMGESGFGRVGLCDWGGVCVCVGDSV